MKKNILIFLVSLISLAGFSQTYNPSLAVPVNKSLGISQYGPTDARTYFYDAVNFTYRPYVSTSEVLSYLNLSKYRAGQFDIIVNTGGTLNTGVITGGTNAVWYFKNGQANGDLVLKSNVISVNGQTGIVVTKSADSLKGQPLDTTVRRNGYAVLYDSVAKKYYLGPSGQGVAYTGSSTIDVTGTVISALNTASLWNANSLRGRSITTNTPVQYQLLGWSGTEFTYYNGGPSNAIFTNDTIYIVRTPGDTIKLGGIASVHYVDSVVATIPLNQIVTHDLTLIGDGTPPVPLMVDTSGYVATKTEINEVNYRIDTLTLSSGGIDTVAHDNTMIGRGTLAVPLTVDTNKIATQSWVTLNFIAPDGSETKVTAGVGIGVAGNGTTGTPYIITAVGSPTGNPFKALTIESYGGVADATVPVSGNNANGTNNTTALNTMLTAAADGQLCIVPSGNWLFSTAISTTPFTTKRINLLILGNTYHNGANFITFPAVSGADKLHHVAHMGFAIGRVNMPAHTKSGGVRISPPWSSFTGSFITIIDNDRNQVEANEITGFKNAFEIIGDQDGSQENNFTFNILYKNANGITLRSTDGTSFCDKNTFKGPNGGLARVSGGLAILIDGYSGTAPNGEIYNGAFRKDLFQNLLFEQLDSLCRFNGDITEPTFINCVVEGGVNTGIFGTMWYQFRTVAPNVVRSPIFLGNSYQSTKWWTNGAGIDGRWVATPWYDDNSSGYLGLDAYGNSSGGITIQCKSSLSQTSRTTNLNTSIFSFLNNDGAPQTMVTISSGSYSVASGVYWVKSSNTTPTITLPSAASFPTREILIQNVATSGSITVANTISGSTTTIYPGKLITYRSDGVGWSSMDNGSIVNSGTQAGYILTNTTGVANSASWQPNYGGWTIVNGTTNSSATPTTLATIPLVTGSGGEIEISLVGYNGANQTWQQHSINHYVKASGVLTIKGSQTVVSGYTADFNPGSVGFVTSGNTAYIYVRSVTTELVQWHAEFVVRPTSTVE